MGDAHLDRNACAALGRTKELSKSTVVVGKHLAFGRELFFVFFFFRKGCFVETEPLARALLRPGLGVLSQKWDICKGKGVEPWGRRE